MLEKIRVETRERIQMIDMSEQVAEVVHDSEIRSGLCVVFIPHTTAAVTINENADPDVQRDLSSFLNKLAPADAPYAHAEGNGDSHAKTSVTGSSITLIIEDGELQLGRWQAIFFCEFDGPRTRQLYVKVMEDR